ncbi:YihY/virulence factor BrkB family protein, partial [Streptomyces sp. NPDC058572]
PTAAPAPAPLSVGWWFAAAPGGGGAGGAAARALDRVWPSVATAAARAANERLRAENAAALLAQARTAHAFEDDDDDDDDDDGDEGGGDMPSEFPERWSKFLPPDDVKSRLHTGRDSGREKDHHHNNRE